MASTSAGTARSKETAAGSHRAISAGVGLAAAVWLTLLSGWLGVRPGTVVTHRHNVIFSSDSNLWIAQMLGNMPPNLAPIHPLQIPFWGIPCRAAAALARVFLPADAAGFLGARIVVAVVAGTGMALLVLLALRKGLPVAHCLALVFVYLLFTSNVTICLPEHFAVSNGLLAITFSAPLLAASSRVRYWMLGVMTVLVGGTTVTNAIFPVLALLQSGLKSARLRLAAIAVGIPGALAAAWFLYRASWTYRWFIDRGVQLRILHDPASTGAFLFYFFVAPAVGPPPLMAQMGLGPMLSYEPLHASLRMSLYFGLPIIGAAAWLVLLCWCTRNAYRSAETRPAVVLLLAWLLFNLIFHNLWGDELMLYAPHWSWSLMALVLLGARRLPRPFVFSATALVIVSQIPTWLAVKRAVETIVIQ
jgi:hypothetical protein